jgi:hypothetical protein
MPASFPSSGGTRTSSRSSFPRSQEPLIVPPAFEEGGGTEIAERLDWARERLGFEAVVAGNRYDEVRAANEGGASLSFTVR